MSFATHEPQKPLRTMIAATCCVKNLFWKNVLSLGRREGCQTTTCLFWIRMLHSCQNVSPLNALDAALMVTKQPLQIRKLFKNNTALNTEHDVIKGRCPVWPKTNAFSSVFSMNDLEGTIFSFPNLDYIPPSHPIILSIVPTLYKHCFFFALISHPDRKLINFSIPSFSDISLRFFCLIFKTETFLMTICFYLFDGVFIRFLAID